MPLDRDRLGEPYGKVGIGNQSMLGIMGNNRDVSVGEIFMIYSKRDGSERVFFFRVLDLENYLRHVDDMSRVAGTLMVEGDAYLSGIERNMLLAVGGKMLGYAELKKDPKSGDDQWEFRSPRRLPDHLADVYRPLRGTSDAVVREMLDTQTGGEIYVGDLQIGESTLDVPISIPAKYLPMHVGIFGSTGAGKSNLMMVLVKAMIDNNLQAARNKDASLRRVSAFCIDPHDEFAQGVDQYGIQDIVEAMDPQTRSDVLGDFYYLTSHLAATSREISRYGRDIRILWEEIQPRDLYSIMDFTPQMSFFIDSIYAQERENWVAAILDMSEDPSGTPSGTVHAVQRRLGVLERSSIFARSGNSILSDIYTAMESGRVLVVNTTLLSDMEQFLLTTVVTRTVSDLRRAAKSSGTLGDFEAQGQVRLPRPFFERVKAQAKKFYSAGGADDAAPMRDLRTLPVIMITVEEAPSILNPQLMQGQSVFKDISRQGRKFNIGLLVVSQQVSVLDNVILSQMNTEINLRLGNEREIKACIENASVNISGFEDEFRVMARGEAILTASYRELPLPLKIPLFDDLFKRDRSKYKSPKARPDEKHML
ncbi:MAG: ATP-binding protein [Candidatus Thorarchaeota archaeon]|nr:ATP-binding protein [Candidatus Thorarchaeota archaeon]